MADRAAVLVTGSRDWTDYGPIRDRLNLYSPGTILLHGNCGKVEYANGIDGTIDWRGADRIADDIGRARGFNIWPLPYFADLGKPGGPRRNIALVDILAVLFKSGFECHVEGFPLQRSVGTRGCLSHARKASGALHPGNEKRPCGAFHFHVTEGTDHV